MFEFQWYPKYRRRNCIQMTMQKEIQKAIGTIHCAVVLVEQRKRLLWQSIMVLVQWEKLAGRQLRSSISVAKQKSLSLLCSSRKRSDRVRGVTRPFMLADKLTATKLIGMKIEARTVRMTPFRACTKECWREACPKNLLFPCYNMIKWDQVPFHGSFQSRHTLARVLSLQSSNLLRSHQPSRG